MSTRPEPAPSPNSQALWAAGEFALRVTTAGEETARVVKVGRPFGLVGRVEGADVVLEDPAVSARHVYLHLDRRGLFAVDLATRSGTRVGPGGGPAGWLRPGQALEIAGHRLELAALRVEAPEPAGAARIEPADPLAGSGPAPRVRVMLYPSRPGEGPLTINSELVFLGRSNACGVRVEAASASRIQCVLVRTAEAAFLVDLASRGTWLNGQPVRGAAALADGDALLIGTAGFEVRLEPAASWSRGEGRGASPLDSLSSDSSLAPRPAPLALAGSTARPGPATTTLATATPAATPASAGEPVLAWPTELLPAEIPPPPAGLVPAEAQGALIAWMLGVIQASQTELARRQDCFQREVVQALRQLRTENAKLLEHQSERTAALHRELSELRDEVRQRFGPTIKPVANPPALPRPPAVAPLRLPTAPEPAQADPGAATAWLLDRVNRIDQENHSSWRDLLGRLGWGK